MSVLVCSLVRNKHVGSVVRSSNMMMKVGAGSESVEVRLRAREHVSPRLCSCFCAHVRQFSPTWEEGRSTTEEDPFDRGFVLCDVNKELLVLRRPADGLTSTERT